jgi:5-histidylcysteine sulfoxide synthase/putative 4-mercaptohistidine N1-methyltranferase
MMKSMTPPQGPGQAIVTHTPSLHGKDAEAKRAEIRQYFHDTFSLYESLFECMNSDEAFYARANPLRHPLIFYYGHTAVFFMNKLNVAGQVKERIDPRIESLFAIGVDEMSWDDLNEQNYDWPTPAEIKAYRDRTREIVDKFISECEVTLPIGWNNPLWIVMMGIEHERIHLETSAVLIRELPLKFVKKHPLWGRICLESGQAPENELLDVAGGKIMLGKSRDNEYYGWDNEYGRFEAKVEPFRASKYLVSNQEYLEFVKDGGYKKRKYWAEEGWNWAVYRKARRPVYWVKKGDAYFYRAMLEEIPMPWDWPVDVNQLEANAFCNWKAEKIGKSIRLSTEAEWNMLRNLVKEDQPTWNKAPGNINLEGYMSACPVDKYAFPRGFYDIVGNVWQWTETPIDGFEGFEAHPLYDDFSTPTFDGKHNLFKGGCWISTGNYAIKDSRYAFRRHFFQNSGIRYVEGEEIELPEPNVYETDSMISMYIEFHYGDTHFGVPNYPKACAEACLEHMKGRRTARALDIGCSTGRASFELAHAFDHVDGLDFSARLLQMPVALQKNGRHRYVIQDEGELVSFKEVIADDLKLGEALRRVSFVQGDACNLAAKYSNYDLVLAGNLIDRLYDPMKFLGMIHERINKGGLLALTSPYTWLQEFTDRSKWLGGFKGSTGESYTTLDGLKDALSPQFTLLETRDIPFVIRETRRKFQHTISQMTVWERK